MNEAKKLKYQEPGFMAVNKENKGSKQTDTGKKNKYWFDPVVLITWIAIILFTIILWYLILKVL